MPTVQLVDCDDLGLMAVPKLSDTEACAQNPFLETVRMALCSAIFLELKKIFPVEVTTHGITTVLSPKIRARWNVQIMPCRAEVVVSYVIKRDGHVYNVDQVTIPFADPDLVEKVVALVQKSLDIEYPL